MEFTVKESKDGYFHVYHNVEKKFFNWLKFKFEKITVEEKYPFYDWVMYKGKLYSNFFRSIEEAKEVMTAIINNRNRELEVEKFTVTPPNNPLQK